MYFEYHDRLVLIVVFEEVNVPLVPVHALSDALLLRHELGKLLFVVNASLQ